MIMHGGSTDRVHAHAAVTFVGDPSACCDAGVELPVWPPTRPVRALATGAKAPGLRCRPRSHVP